MRSAIPVFPAAVDLAGVRRNERRFRALTGAFSDVVWLADADGQLISDMPAWRMVTGQSVDQLLGRGWLEGVHPDDRSRVAEDWEAAQIARSQYEVTCRVFGADAERWLDLRGAPVLDEDGRLLEWSAPRSTSPTGCSQSSCESC